MRGNRGIVVGMLALAVGVNSGCQSSGLKRPSTVITPAPTVSTTGDADGAVSDRTISSAPVNTVRFADRHPLFSKPREYWETSGDNKVVKAAAATFIGVPAGFVGEVRQIIVGRPAQPPY